MNSPTLAESTGEKHGAIRPSSWNDSLLHASRWWFASSIFPMIAGTLGPVANAFSVCALSRPWRQHVPIDDGNFVKDPSWLIIVNAIQLAGGIVSNVFLFLDMTRRVRFSIAQPITIIGWYLSSICLICLLATATGPLQLQPEADYIWSEAFWYGMWAAILYFLVATLMSVTAYGALRGHYPLDFPLTLSQRTLMLQAIMLLVYILLGALVFAALEGWSYLNSVYWANVTLFTIGFGDIVLTTTAGRALVIPYALVGIVSVGLVIDSIRTLVLQRAGRRLDARRVEKKRRKVVAALSRQGRDDILRPVCPDPDCDGRQPGDDPNAIRSELERREAEFNLMRLIQHGALVRRRWVATFISMGPWLLLWLLGAFIFVEFERPYQGWSYFDGVYFAFISLVTLGYGDLTPVSNGGRSFFVFWALLALPTMTVLISNAGDTVVKVIRDVTLRVGSITILPNAHNIETDARLLLHMLSCGILFRDRFSVETLVASGDSSFSRKTKEERASAGAQRDRRDHDRMQHPTFPNPASEAEYHFLLISAISAVSDDVRSTPEKRYTFQEWAYYLHLLGEDERSPRTHRMPRFKSRAHHRNSQSATLPRAPGPLRRILINLRLKPERRPRFTHADIEEEEEDGETWSWVGPRSPLMGGGESEWLLERLTERLVERLQSQLASVRSREGVGQWGSEEARE